MYLLARVENFSRFDGESLNAEPVMRYGQQGNPPHELYNFSVASDGYIYGYLPKDGGGKLARLGGAAEDKKISGVTIIFISDGTLCGYYREATVFADTIRHPDKLRAGKSKIFCRVRVRPENAYLIPVDERIHSLEPRPKGQSPVLYGDADNYWIAWFEKLISDGSVSSISEKKRRKWSRKVERSSDARKIAIKEFGLKCQCCDLECGDKICSAVFEVHHKIPYANDFKDRKITSNDLSVLCANCHRMIHKMPDLADIDALKAYVRVVGLHT
ncbi:HNH endonuclease [Paracoccaceae bacterium GXU_MW_L88]